MPLILTDVAPVWDHERVVDCPCVMLVGLVVKEEMVGGWTTAVTVTVTCLERVPPLFEATKVYVIVCVGATASDEPLTDWPLILRDVVPVVDHDSVELWPAVMLAGFAVNEVIDGGGTTGALTITVTCLDTIPPLFVAVRV
jgi:hypothetical protein